MDSLNNKKERASSPEMIGDPPVEAQLGCPEQAAPSTFWQQADDCQSIQDITSVQLDETPSAFTNMQQPILGQTNPDFEILPQNWCAMINLFWKTMVALNAQQPMNSSEALDLTQCNSARVQDSPLDLSAKARAGYQYQFPSTNGNDSTRPQQTDARWINSNLCPYIQNFETSANYALIAPYWSLISPYIEERVTNLAEDNAADLQSALKLSSTEPSSIYQMQGVSSLFAQQLVCPQLSLAHRGDTIDQQIQNFHHDYVKNKATLFTLWAEHAERSMDYAKTWWPLVSQMNVATEEGLSQVFYCPYGFACYAFFKSKLI